MDYLLKVTIAWTLFLLLFEMLYKNNTKFTANRIYLLLSMVTALLLPVIPLPSTAPAELSAVQNFYTAAQSSLPETVLPVQQNAVPATASVMQPADQSRDLMQMVGIIYMAGVLILFMKCLFELYKISQLIRRNPAEIIHGHQVITTGKIHSPYSFMGRIFLTSTAFHDPKELEYIIRHEAAHSTRKHWLDLWIFQLACIVLWFHPLIWRYRYLLQLQHEYEADAMASNEDRYNYGQFLLRQTLLNGVPSVTHSFHFSPIKNRINMLTKSQSFKAGSWKYMLLVPVLLGCTLLMATNSHDVEYPLQGNSKTFKGNTFTWRESDTLFYDKQRQRAELVPAQSKIKPQIIESMNDEPVYQNDFLQYPATFGNADTAFAHFIIKEFRALRKNTPDSLVYLVDVNLVIDREGKIVFYDAHYDRPPESAFEQRKFWDPFFQIDTQPNVQIDQILDNSPDWKPAIIDGKPVNSFVRVRFPGC